MTLLEGWDPIILLCFHCLLSTVSDNQNYLFFITQINSGLAVLHEQNFLETPLYTILSFLKHLFSLFAMVSDAAWFLSEPSKESDKEEQA